ncbi:nucleotidyltransferase family protein [Stenotrophomonas sp. ZAC14D1_NAIMI4_6]|uniref:NTP transferase domain-containing protein n=1 Tax=unclassified Stenotrophomonas maltophilia group TaxID=2961925 RepID=UPI000D54125C|nr:MULTISPECIES: NTP transferase domain-containing protein [unclassified Stenotrophomonas maltophilia group]AWH37310.1 nucleotidyltransferase family protein [Stenotrophomonas sp. ZAC14D1_NAIMI4_6]AWH41500.1 nucleotidyltransferase family protein [Stenotrophomonas sp. ZAC14D1_NAIMI4_1]
MAAWQRTGQYVSGHAAVVLAAGLSRRLGRPKQWLQVEGESLLRRAARLASETDPDVLIVVTPQGPAFGSELSGLRAVQVENPAPALGIGSSLRLAAPHLGTARHVLVLVCDQPRLHAAHLRALLAAAASTPCHCAATLEGGVPGSPAVVPAAWFSGLPESGGDRGFGRRLRQTPGVALCISDASLRDIDDADDLRAALAAGWIDTPPQ